MSLGRVVIARDVGGAPVELWSELPVVQELPHLLWPDEVVRAVFIGGIARHVRPTSRKWLIVLTDQRVLCVKRRRMSAAPKVVDVHYDALTHVTTRSRILKATVLLTTSLGTLRLRVSRADSHRIVQAISSLRRGHTPLYVTPPIPPGAQTVPEAARYSKERVEQLETNVEHLETELARMQRQLDFIENLLQTRVPLEELPESRQSLPPPVRP